MFVLPRMKAVSRGLPVSCHEQSAEESPTIKLSPVLLAYWGLPLYSELPEESAARTQLMESYLLGLIHIFGLHNASVNAIFKTAIENVMRDEVIEREFFEEDAEHSVIKLFIDFTRRKGLMCLQKREAAERLRVIDSYFLATLNLFGHFEFIHREHVAQQFLDSLFLKKCQLCPWRNWPQRSFFPSSGDDVGSKAAAVMPSVDCLLVEEREKRCGIIARFFGNLHLILEVLAVSEKRILYNNNILQDGISVRFTLDRLATVIQSTFRGFLLRQGQRRCGGIREACCKEM